MLRKGSMLEPESETELERPRGFPQHETEAAGEMLGLAWPRTQKRVFL